MNGAAARPGLPGLRRFFDPDGLAAWDRVGAGQQLAGLELGFTQRNQWRAGGLEVGCA
jgi:hypothetical protein